MKFIFRAADGLLFALAACMTGLLCWRPALWPVLPPTVVLSLLANVFPTPLYGRYRTARLRICAAGCDLLISFLTAAALTAAAHVTAAFYVLPAHGWAFAMSCLTAVAVLSVVFWNGIIRVYATSVQLGVRIRVIGLLCGWIPVVHLIALIRIISVCAEEVRFENEKILCDEKRRGERICQTRYPILLVHGVFFRDFRYLNYWGRIPKALETNGAVLFYGNHQSALSVADSAAELTERIRQIVQETGCQKVNIIAHSKGGLDCRYAISRCGAAPYVASLTTINTPHRGCLFADYLLQKVPVGMKNTIASGYNAALKKMGDTTPDFIASVTDLTAESCRVLNETVPDADGIFYQSVGSRLNRALDGKFPLNFSYPIAKYFDGPNDGLVAETACEWGEKFTFLTTEGHRGISHGDMIDLNRENIKGFDVREFYVQLVADLKNRGL